MLGRPVIETEVYRKSCYFPYWELRELKSCEPFFARQYPSGVKSVVGLAASFNMGPMNSGNPIHWTDPSTWPWFVYVWMAMFMIGWIKPLWRWFQRNRASGWPGVGGQVESVAVNEAKRSFFSPSLGGSSPSHVAELRYSYSPAGNREVGCYKREFGTEGEASEFVRELQGKPVAVHYNPDKPSVSTLSEASIESLLQTRAPKPSWQLSTSSLPDSVPEWLQPFLWIFVGISALGFVLSLWVHLGAVAGRRVAPAPLFWILHMAIFIVWFSAVMVAKRQVGNLRRKDLAKVIFKGFPDWVRYLVNGFLAYAFINFMYFVTQAPTHSNEGGDPPAMVWRGFSGHWMVFYLYALAILYSAARQNADGRRCTNGHMVQASANFCSRCGQPVTQGLPGGT